MLLHFAKGFAVEWGKAVFFDEGIVEFGTIPLVNFEGIVRVFRAHTAHQAISCDLSHN